MASYKFTPVLPAGSIVLITGVSGYIGARIADETIAAGYRVRGATRNPNSEKIKWMTKHFDEKYGPGKFEAIQFSEYKPGPKLDEALKDVAGIAHVAVNTDFSLAGKPEPYISDEVNAILTFLKAANASPSLKRVVFTSSSMAAIGMRLNEDFSFDENTYNEDFLNLAYEEPYALEKIWFVYAACKVKSERAIWAWYEEQKKAGTLTIDVATILPSTNLGLSLDGGWESTGTWAKIAYDGNMEEVQGVSPQHFIDVQDTAFLHLGALIHPEAGGHRYFGFFEPWNFNKILATWRRISPEKKFVDDIPDEPRDLSHPPKERAVWLLKELGREGPKSLEQSLREALAGAKETNGPVKNALGMAAQV